MKKAHLLPHLLCRSIPVFVCDVSTKLQHNWTFLDEVVGLKIKHLFIRSRSLTFHPSNLAEIFLYLCMTVLPNYMTTSHS